MVKCVPFSKFEKQKKTIIFYHLQDEKQQKQKEKKENVDY